jgi:hypothetical protein
VLSHFRSGRKDLRLASVTEALKRIGYPSASRCTTEIEVGVKDVQFVLQWGVKR